jgi:uncharacterized membrane protein
MTVAVATYQAYKVVHVVAAIVWLGGALAFSALGTRVARSDDPRHVVGFLKDIKVVGDLLFAPAGILVLVFGFLMIHEGHLGFHQLWIQLGLGLFLVTFVSGMLFFGPESARIAKAIERDGPESPEAIRRVRRILLISRLDLLTIYSIAVVMVAKPTAHDGLLFGVWGATLAVLAAAALRSFLRSGTTPAAAPAPGD